MPPSVAGPVPFGKYLLIDKIASGGMAEVFRAVLRGAAGFEKHVALKRILPVFCEEPDFVRMFQDEARIASTLSHANIAQVFELGEVDGGFYLCLELVEGLDLAKMLAKLRGAGQPMPLATAAFIVAEVARGLAYAHDKTAPDGRRIGIVHRDVSPPNVLVSRAGDVKLADFGIAKAAGKAHKTETGVIMGKLRYMSPEQVAGEELDARSDIFSLGVILYELLAGGPLWPVDQPLRLAELIRKAEIPPPSTRNAAVPPELDAIALRALAPRREDRYQRAGDLAKDLSHFVSTAAPGFTRDDLGALVATMAPAAAAMAPTEMVSLVEITPEPPAPPPPPPPRPETLNLRPRRSWSAGTWIGLVLGAIIVGSGLLVLVRFFWPSGETLRGADAGRVVLAPSDAGPRAPEPVPTAPFTLAATASRDDRITLAKTVDAFDVTRRGMPGDAYDAFITGLDGTVAGLVLDKDGHALEPSGLPLTVHNMVDQAGVADALAATVVYLRATGELPPLVKTALRGFLAGRPSTIDELTAQSMGLRWPYSASLLAVWLEPGNRDRLRELAYANGMLGRPCDLPPAPMRLFAPLGCDTAALIAALRVKAPSDPTARALERWAAATPPLPDVHVQYQDAPNPAQLVLVVQLPAPVEGAIEIIAADQPASPLAAAPEEPGLYSATVPRRLIAPVLKVGEQLVRLPAPPFAR